MTVAGRLRSLPRRAVAAGHRLAFPEASSAAEHWQRVILDRAIEQYLDWLDPRQLSAAEISGDTHADKPWREYTGLIYPDFDVCAPVTGADRYDVVLCEQVLEHVDDPLTAASNLRELCVPGGHVIVSTPFLIRVHELPIFLMRDYWRFTPRGLQVLLERAGLEIVAAGAWGNRECVIGNFSRWSAYRRWHPLRNEVDYPVQVWAFARNPQVS